MKTIGTLSRDCGNQGTFSPWFTGVDAASRRDAGKARARSKATCVAPGRPETGRVQRGHGWAAVDSTALSPFR